MAAGQGRAGPRHGGATGGPVPVAIGPGGDVGDGLSARATGRGAATGRMVGGAAHRGGAGIFWPPGFGEAGHGGSGAANRWGAAGTHGSAG